MFDEDIKKTKELEKRKWLDELNVQKKEKLIESQQQQQRQLNINTSTLAAVANTMRAGVNTAGDVSEQQLSLANMSPRALKHLKVSAIVSQRAQLNELMNNVRFFLSVLKSKLKCQSFLFFFC